MRYFILCQTALILLSSQIQAAAALSPMAVPIEAKDLYLDKIISDLSLSPDGKRVAYAEVSGTKTGVYVIDLETRETETWMWPDWVEVGWIDWANNERLLIARNFEASTKRGRTYWKYPRSEILSATSNRIGNRVVFDDTEFVFAETFYHNGLVSTLPDDPEHILIPVHNGKTVEVHRSNVVTGETSLVARGEKDTYRWITRRDGTPILRLDVDKNFTEYQLYSTPDGGKNWTFLRKIELDEDGDSDDFSIIAPAASGTEVYVRAYGPGDEYASIKLYDVLTGNVTQTVYTVRCGHADHRQRNRRSHRGKLVSDPSPGFL